MPTFELEQRKCKGCDETFKVYVKSKQKYHSEACRIMTEKLFEEYKMLRMATKDELWFFHTGQRPKNKDKK